MTKAYQKVLNGKISISDATGLCCVGNVFVWTKIVVKPKKQKVSKGCEGANARCEVKISLH